MENPLDDKDDWLGSPNEPLTGFSWKAGAERHTSGIVMWSDVFLYEASGEKYAIVFVDTQGLFDDKTSPADNSRIFALGTLLSSTQIFNLNDVIQENQLQYLQIATEYAKFAGNQDTDSTHKPFQKLIFLLRDWVNKVQYPYGLAGGETYLKSVLEPTAGNKLLKPMREYISNTFDEISCFLMPHPGLQVATKKFTGASADLPEEFKKQLSDFVSWMLKPENLKAKRVLNKEITASEFAEYTKEYLKTFQSSALPATENIYKITVQQQHNALVKSSLEIYKEYINSNAKFTDKNFEANLDAIHISAGKKAYVFFKNSNVLGKLNHADEYKVKLNTAIDKEFNEWKIVNLKNHKNHFDLINKTDSEKLALIKKAGEKIRMDQLEHDRKTKLLQDKLAADKTAAEEKEKYQLAEAQRQKNELYQTNLANLKKANEECESKITGIRREYQLSLDAKTQKEEAAKAARDKIANEKLVAEAAFFKKLEEEQKKFNIAIEKLKQDSAKQMQLASSQSRIQIQQLEMRLKVQALKHKAELLKLINLYGA